MSKINWISKNEPKNKSVVMRVDFNVTLGPGMTISDDARIKQALPTIELLLNNGNRLVLLSHLGRPKGREAKYSLAPVAKRLGEFLKSHKVRLAENFEDVDVDGENEVVMLENLRYWEGEKKNNSEFVEKLASLGDVYVNDAFGVSHRRDASVVGLPKLLPSFGGLLLKREIETINDIVGVPFAPVVSIIGGAKIETKVPVIEKLLDLSDSVLVGGAAANTFLVAKGIDMGESLFEKEFVDVAGKILREAKRKGVELLLPVDGVVGDAKDEDDGGDVVKIDKKIDGAMLDIGPQTQAEFGHEIDRARTIIWNGPMGYNENPQYARGTEFLFYAIAENSDAKSLVGGGDTIVSIAKEEHLENITHISTGGGAMLEYIERGTLPGVEALKARDEE